MKELRYRTADALAEIEWELKSSEKGLRFSASGTYEGCMGQCIDTIAAAYPDDEMVQRIAKVWQEYHINDMQAGCEHQQALGWGNGKNVAVMVSDMTKAQRAGLTKRLLDGQVGRKRLEFIKELKSGLLNSVSVQARAWQAITGTGPNRFDLEMLSRISSGIAAIIGQRKEIAAKLNNYITNAAEMAHPVVIEDRIYKDSLCAPCPECGYCYGTEWNLKPIPADVVAEIESWESNADRELYLDAADEFLKRNGITLEAKRGNKPCPWDGPSGTHYEVTLDKPDGEKPLVEFDFWDCQANVGKAVSTHSILSCVASDIYTPETFAEFCSEYGYEEDSRKAEKMFNTADVFARKLRAFFTKAEKEQLQLIR